MKFEKVNKLLWGIWGLLFCVSCGKEKDALTAITSLEMPVAFGSSGTEGWRNVTSKAGVLAQTSLLTKGFGVFAYYTNKDNFESTIHRIPNFMNNTRVTSANEGTAWEYAPVKYWPNTPNEKLSFLAYAPYFAGARVDGSQLSFTVAKKVEEQLDISWSNSNTINQTKQGITGTVNFNFKHALARIGFTVLGQTNGIPLMEKSAMIRIKKVELRADFYAQGMLELKNTGSVADWKSLSGSNTSYVLEPEHFNGGAADGFLLDRNNASEAQSLNADDAYLMILPQDFSGSGVVLYVEYDVRVHNGEHDEECYTNKMLSAPVKLNFEAGKSYTLNLILGLKEMTLSVSMVDWENVDVNNTPLKLVE